MPISKSRSKSIPIFPILMEIAAVWIASDVGYYVLFGASYTIKPILITIYYLGWLLLTIFSFQDAYRRWKPIEYTISTFILLGLGALGIFLYLNQILPHFPPIHWAQPWQPPSELLFANAWYFLPKSIEILLQQLLVAAMVLVFSSEKYNLKEISIWCALLFGGAHLLLVFGSEGVAYVTIFTSMAVIASFIFPYLILKVKNGIIYSYLLHWLFYACVVILAHLIFKV